MHHLWLIPFFPLAGFLVNGIFGRRFSKSLISMVAVGSVALSFAWALKCLLALAPLETPHVERYFMWIESGSLAIPYELAVDRLTAIMLMVVTGIGSLIHIYAVGYMHEEDSYYRFFSFFNLFMFFMLTLVLANNFLLLFVGWEGVGLCSYLLIGYYFLKHSASTAGNKAFIVNRIGDFGFSLAMFLIFITFGSLDFPKVFEAAKAVPVEASAGMMTAICLLLLVGATGKSAQVPLYVWLPDAMEGPTPVSALIHAATMVTAGVYMVARSAAIFTKAPIAMETVAWVGVATAVMAATIGMTQFDIKKVYAYSTVSQLGYMFMALGVGAFSAGIWHVVTHAFFKALLFLGAGSVIHALHHEQDMRNMGGLRTKIPITFAVLACAWIAISGVPFTSGWYSKEAILGAVHHHSPLMYWIGVVTAAVTAFYVSRSMFMTFFGEYRGHAHPHESPPVMWAPLAVLAVLSLAGGFLFNVPHILEPLFPVEHGGHDIMLEIIGSAAGLVGIGLAYVMYMASPGLPESISTSLGGVYRLVYNKYYVDEAYDATVVRPLVNGSRTGLWQFGDVWLIDGVVNGMGGFARWIGGGLRTLQSGSIRSYAAWVVAGAVIFIIAAGAIAGSNGGLR
ncbi:MAG: NADH-quinone oxidoreductase subunit L [Bryobacterales bacterium]|nr:NADH-quinone oxidoreductase subunit L [Bryobacterales bacterium]